MLTQSIHRRLAIGFVGLLSTIGFAAVSTGAAPLPSAAPALIRGAAEARPAEAVAPAARSAP